MPQGQIGNELFQVEEGTKNCLWVNLSGVTRQENPMIVEATDFALCKMNESHVFVCGGQNSKVAQRFSVREKLWEALPELNVPRAKASAVAINGSVYVICGMVMQGGEEDPYGSIEKLVNACGPQ